MGIVCFFFKCFASFRFVSFHFVSSRLVSKKIGKVGYWATSISTVRTTVLSEKVIKTDLFPDLDIFRILDMTTSRSYRSQRDNFGLIN